MPIHTIGLLVLLLTAAPNPAAIEKKGDDLPESNHSTFELLLRADNQQRSALLGRLVPCTGGDSSFMGHGVETFYWTVWCMDGRSFAIQVMPKGAADKVMPCHALYEKTGVRCPRRVSH